MLGIAIILFGTLLRAQDVMIVVNRGSSVSEITEAQLRDIFTGARSRIDDGARAIPVLLKGGPTHEVFLHRHIRETPDEFRARWRKAVFTGQGSMSCETSRGTAMSMKNIGRFLRRARNCSPCSRRKMAWGAPVDVMTMSARSHVA